MRILMLSLLLCVSACLHYGDALEAACIKGRLSAKQAAAVNASTWERRPGYCAGESYRDDKDQERQGGSHCDAERFDRVLAAHCSVAIGVSRHGD